MAGTLYIVATPIGNLEDITLRAIRVLKEVAIIAAEDTRRARILLSRYAIEAPLTSYHEHNEKTKAGALVERLQKGEDVALVSDAGTPTLSDPGYRLVREAIRAGIRLVPIPGPSALTAVLGVSGLPVDRFVFEGFLPAKKEERRERLKGLREERRTLIFFETPHRLKDSLRDLLEVLGDREVVLGREVTKIHEEFLRGTLSQVSSHIDRAEPRGEITVVIKGAEQALTPPEGLLISEIQRLKRKGLRVKEIAELLGEKYSYPKREVYRLALQRGEE